MSRTIRRKGVKDEHHFDSIEEHNAYWDHYFAERYAWRVGYNMTDMRARHGLNWHWHSDMCNWRGKARSKAREHSTYRRKQFDKDLRSKLMKDPDHDYYHFEKDYLGDIWIFD